MANKMYFTHEALQGRKYLVSCTREICPECNGYGRHDRRDIDISRLLESMAEDGDYQGMEDYRKGCYDQVCERCKGERVIDVPNLDEVPIDEFKLIDAWNDDVRESKMIEAQERRMGA